MLDIMNFLINNIIGLTFTLKGKLICFFGIIEDMDAAKDTLILKNFLGMEKVLLNLYSATLNQSNLQFMENR